MNRLFLIALLLPLQTILFSQETEIKDPVLTENWSNPPALIKGIKVTTDIPEDAIILLGRDAASWRTKEGNAVEWGMENGVLTVKPGTGNIYSKASFGDCHLHLEWRTPAVIKGSGQGRGNSGVFLQSRYEVQILDSYQNETYYNGQAGSIYKQKAPLRNATSAPGEWNTYDIIFKAPVFDLYGSLIEKARVTVIHNGIVVQNNTEIQGTTEYIGYPKIEAHGGAPIILQDHGDLVSFRNIWIRRL